MQPMDPKERAKLVERFGEHLICEYEKCLAAHFWTIQ
jgi:hypothetical protein